MSMRVGIYGATGYTGYELVKIFQQHPEVEVIFLTSERYAGRRFSDIYPCPYDLPLVSPDDATPEKVDVALLCTPHGASAVLAQRVLEAGARCVDLSADFRLHDAAVYNTWYGTHPVPDLLGEAVYGLTEVYREQIADARLVANPGCYPTGPLLALHPLLNAGMVTSRRVIIDAKSGVSGAGARPTEKTHFVSVHDNLSAYNIGHTHRHVPEIEQELSLYCGQPLRVVFTPHLLPVSRGILSAVYVDVDPSVSTADVVALWNQAYADAPFVHVLDTGQLATLAHVVNTNRCALSVAPAGGEGELILITALDNLVKGASGAAVQNMNVMFGLDETLGLWA